MSVYARFKRSPEGFRKLVELLETTPPSRRQKMIDVGMEEDAEYTNRALQYVMNFQDILALSDGELAEVCAKAPAKMIAYSIRELGDDVKKRFVTCCTRENMAEVRDTLEVSVGPREIAGAQLKLIQVARELEGKGFVRIKKIPLGE